MTKKEEVDNLTKLLGNITSKSSTKELVDEEIPGLAGEEYVPKVKTKNWAGLKIPKTVYSICTYYKDMLSEKGLYSTALDFSIYSAAVQYILYNDMVTRICDPKCPRTSKPRPQEILGVAEALRKALRELGLSRGTCDRHGQENLKDHNDPIGDMLKNLSEPDEEEEIISRKK